MWGPKTLLLQGAQPADEPPRTRTPGSNRLLGTFAHRRSEHSSRVWCLCLLSRDLSRQGRFVSDLPRFMTDRGVDSRDCSSWVNRNSQGSPTLGYRLPSIWAKWICDVTALSAAGHRLSLGIPRQILSPYRRGLVSTDCKSRTWIFLSWRQIGS